MRAGVPRGGCTQLAAFVAALFAPRRARALPKCAPKPATPQTPCQALCLCRPPAPIRYRLLEIELDNVFRCMLLLKKKKYAAMKLEPSPEGGGKLVEVGRLGRLGGGLRAGGRDAGFGLGLGLAAFWVCSSTCVGPSPLPILSDPLHLCVYGVGEGKTTALQL